MNNIFYFYFIIANFILNQIKNRSHMKFIVLLFFITITITCQNKNLSLDKDEKVERELSGR